VNQSFQETLQTGPHVNRLTAREVRTAFFRTKHGFFLLFGAAFGGIPAIIAVLMSISAARHSALLREGAPARAVVVAKEISSSDDSTSYYIYYEFAAADGKTYGGHYSTDNRDYYSKEKGDRFDVRYSREDPFDVAVVGHSPIPIKFVIPFLSIFILVGGTLFVIGARGMWRQFQVFGRGEPVWGKSLGVQSDSSMLVNGRPCRYLEFQYVDAQGFTHRGRSSYLSEKMEALLEGRDTVPVVYSPDNPDQADLDLDRLQT